MGIHNRASLAEEDRQAIMMAGVGGRQLGDASDWGYGGLGTDVIGATECGKENRENSN